MATLIKTDKNGTKYYSDCKCRKCGGSGYLYGYEHVAGGVCFKCGGTGIENSYSWKEYTPEYAAKLAERRRLKAIAKAPQANKEFFIKNGFDENGNIFIVIGDTFAIKDNLKAAGAKYSDMFGWSFATENNGFNCVCVNISEIGYLSDLQIWQLESFDFVYDYIKNKRNTEAPKTNSNYIGVIGENVKVKVTLKRISTFETHFTYYGETNYIYSFVDENGNTLVWKTSSFKEIAEGESYTIQGKIKEHSEYKGDKQTILTRCKIA